MMSLTLTDYAMYGWTDSMTDNDNGCPGPCYGDPCACQRTAAAARAYHRMLHEELLAEERRDEPL